MQARHRRRSATTRTLLVAILLAAVPAAAATSGVAEEIRAVLARADSAATSPTVQRELPYLRRFYEERGYASLWLTASGSDERARALLALFRGAAAEGLAPQDYAPETLAARLDTTPVTKERATLDVLLSAAFLQYAGELRRGRLDPRTFAPELFSHPDAFDRTAALATAATIEDVSDLRARFAPRNAPYERLRRALREARRIAADGGWPAVSDGPALKRGMQAPRVAVLRERLIASGDLSPRNGDAEAFDALVEHAVIRFQRRHGLEADGIVGRNTLQALNVPVAQRIRQLALNMERWRWMPDDLGDRYVLVNIAGFEVEVIDYGSVALRMQAIVGRPYRKTPVFSDEITYLEINPTWTVPPRIARLDILPKVRTDPAYLENNGFRVFAGWSGDAPAIEPASVDWQAMDAEHLPFRLVQQPGPQNALGRIKFMFPNEHDVYLHDTPSRELFGRPVRMFSSGCIRVEQPLELAEYLLADTGEWPAARIRDVLAGGTRTRVSLKTPIPVHLIYATAWLGEGGTLHFRDDVYARDAELARALGMASDQGPTGK